MKINKDRSFSQVAIVTAILFLFSTDSRLKDGPYVLYINNKADARYINNNAIETKNIDELSAATDLDNIRFPIVLKKELHIESAVYEMPEKLLSLSDIEGNFEAFRKLLQSAKVIDDKFNWTFGKGHLVFCGDMFDRGEQVTECLWLAYTLEEKAKIAGGYVHFILGNHEIMNLNGDNRFVREKYLTNARLLNSNYRQLFDENSELGRWLRTKNIMERIGDIIFLHGGISREVNELHMTIEQINNTARPWYDKEESALVSKDKNLDILFSNKSPFWSRWYYADTGKVKMEDVNTTLALYNARHIVTGHTIVSDTVSVHFDGKIINTDTKHAGGKSEALLVEADSYYRVNAKGDKVLLLKGQRIPQ